MIEACHDGEAKGCAKSGRAGQNHLISFFSIVEEFYDPVHGRQQAGPCVRASNSKQCAFADLERVLQMLEELWHVFLHLAKRLHVGVDLLEQKLHNAEDIFAHRAGERLRGNRMLIAMGAEVLYQLADAIVLVGFIADRSGVLLRASGFLAIRAGPPLNS